MRLSTVFGILAAWMVFSGCGPSGGDEVSGDTVASGKTAYEDSETDHDGMAQEPEAPAPQPESDPIQVEIVLSGTGDLGVVPSSCSLDQGAGQFTSLLSGTGEIDENGLYIAGFLSSEATFFSPSGCELPEVSVATLTSVEVVARLSNTQENCNSYCSAKARSQAEAECGSYPNDASCRVSAEADYTASCETTCNGASTRVIVARSSLSISAVATLNATALGVDGLGNIEVDLTFDHIEEANGEPVSRK